MGERRGLCYRLNDARLIVCSLEGQQQASRLTAGGLDPIEVDLPVRTQRRDLHGRRGKPASIEDAWMFARADDQSFERRFPWSDAKARIERGVGRLGAAGDKGDRPRRSAAEASDLCARVLDNQPRRPPLGVDRRRVAGGVHRDKRGFTRLWAKRRSRIVIEIGPCRCGGQ